MTEKKRKLSHEILGLIGISTGFALILFIFLTNTATTIAEVYCFEHDMIMTEFDWMEVDRWIFGASGVVCVICFSTLFLLLLRDRLIYIHRITRGIDALQSGTAHPNIPLVGNNELTELAAAINQMASAQQQIRQQEQNLAQEKEQLIRTLSHDIRTPLTSILAYTEYLTSLEDGTTEQQEYLHLIRKKALQIRELTDILLDGGKRNIEYFEDARLLMEQLAAEFEETLEDRFQVQIDFSGCPRFSGNFDVRELRRIFDNLSSNVQKYAASDAPVTLYISLEGDALQIRQTNGVAAAPKIDGYQLGMRSIQRIAQHYAGQVEIRQELHRFEICITLLNH